ncbi:MAG TPA: YbaB/EbfC family nucleoid-associated protein, partial [Chloroflexota bacterium]|nr:YbaB/EbfC family nucleoid-associated protein [Chloroflexota bacterium]
AVDPDDVETLQDLVLAAVNDGLKTSQELAQKKMASLTGGLKIPGLM